MSSKLSGRKHSILLSAILCVAVAAMIVFSAVTLVNYVNRTIHTERSSYLSNQTESAATLVNTALGTLKDYVTISRNVVSNTLEEGGNIYDYMDELCTVMNLNGNRLILIDENCTWYGSKNSTGRITAVEYYTKSTADDFTYITKGVDSDVESFVIRLRLPEPISVSTGHGNVKICFIAGIVYMTVLHEKIVNFFPYQGNSFIVDDTGLMLYRNFSLGVIMPGSNIFTKYEEANFLYGDTGEDQLAKIHHRQTVVGEFKADGQNYFICCAPLDSNNWSLSFVVPAELLSSGSYVHTFTTYMIIICLVITLAAVFIIMLFVANRNKYIQLEAKQKANTLLEEAARVKGNFISNMSHDIRTPINGIIGMSYMAQKEEISDKVRSCLHNIDVSASHLLSLLNDVLDMGSIENGKMSIHPKPICITQVLEDSVTIAHGQMENRALTLKTDFAVPSHRMVLADDIRLRQIFLNLLSNSIKYTRDGGSILFRMEEVSSSDEQSSYRFTLQDTGIGMKPEFLRHIWEPFTQEEGGSRTKYKGTGLGMTITKTLTELMGGVITVTSEYEKGSCFTLTIPFPNASSEEPLPEVKNPEETVQKAALNPEARVLLAEDNEMNRIIAEDLLTDENVLVESFENGKQAVEAFESHEAGYYSLILMDIMMPEMNGLEATRAIRSMKKQTARSIPIIAMSANVSEEDKKECLAAGMNGHLGKPIDIQALHNTLIRYCQAGKK